MKYKLLRFSLLSLLVMLGGMAYADQVTMEYPGGSTANMTGGNDAATFGLDATAWSVIADKGENSNFPGLNQAGDFRLYYSAGGSNTITVTSLTGATINSIEMTFTGDNYSKVSVTVNNQAVTATDGKYNINSSSFVLGNANTSNTQVRIKKVVIDYTAAGGQTDNRTATAVTVGEDQAGLVNTTMNLPAAVVKAGETAVDGATVTWASSNEDVAKIDGTTLQLLAPGTANITATYAGNETYKPSSASFKVTVSKPYTTIGAMLQDITGTKTNVTYTFENLLVRYVSGSYTYVTDGKDNMLFYGRELGLVAGDIISGSVKGQLYTYNMLPELSLTASDIAVQVASSNNEVVPSVIELNALSNNINNYVTIKNAVFVEVGNGKNLNFKVGEETLTVYNQFNLDVTALVADKAYDITGFGSKNNDTYQIYPTEIKEAAGEQGGGFRDFGVDLRDAKGGIITAEEAGASTTITFGLSVAADGTVSRVAADAANAAAVITGKTGNNHGLQSFAATVPVEGPVKITMSTCSWGGDVTITNAEGATITSFSTKKGEGGSGCYKGNGDNDENVISATYAGEATTLTISGGAYVGWFSVKAVDATACNVTFSKGDVECQGDVVPTGGQYASGDKFTIPAQNFTLYKEGYTLTGWTDGENTYDAGSEITLPKGDLTLTPVFAQNEVSLSDRTEPVTLKWNFRRDQGAPAVGWEGKTGLVWVAQATVNGKTIDVALPFSTSPGKFNNKSNTDWVQINNGTTFTVPSCKGATISMEAYNDITTTTIDGQTDYTQGKTISYEIAGAAESVDVVIGDGSYYRYIQVVLPVVQSQAGGEKFDNVAGTIHWPVGNEQAPTISDGIAGGISSASVSTGSELTISTAKYFDTDMVHYTPKASNAGNVEGVMVEYRVKPAKGITFKPTQVDYAAVKVGTDNATYSWSYTVDGVESSITQIDAKPDLLRNSGSNSVENGGTAKLMHTETFDVDACNEFTLRFYISACANNKNICIGNLTISGIVNGEAVSVNMYKLTTAVAPEEGGSINVYPVSEEYEEGSDVTLTATENFGYDFVNWTDAAGTVVSEEAKFKYTMNADATLTANFKKVNTYELALTVDGTNDYMVTIAPAPTVVEGKNMYEEGTAVELTANQYEGLVTFTNWSDGETGSTKTISMTDNVTLTANYAEKDIIAGWDFYLAGNNGRKADFASADNDAAALSLVNTESGETSGWLDKSTDAGGGYESFKGAAVNWRTGEKDGDVGNWHWQTKVNAEAFTDINVQFQMLYNYNAYQTYNAEYSLDGEAWTKFGSVTMEGAKAVGSFSEKLPEACNNKAELYIRMIADKTSKVDGSASKNDGNTLAMFFITGTPKLVDDGTAPVLVSSVPENNATGASAKGKIVLTFDEKVKVADKAQATLGSQNLTPAVSGKVVTFEYKGLEYATEYTFNLPANSVADLTDNFLAEAISIKFTTMSRPTVTKGAYDAVVSTTAELSAAIKEANNRADKTTRYRIFVKKGTYKLPTGDTKHYTHSGSDGTVYWEGDLPDPITYVRGANISLIGEDRDATIITQDITNDDDMLFQGQFGKAHKYEEIGNSAVLQLEGSATGLYFQDITIKSGINDALGRNLAVHDKASKTIYKNTVLYGYQDTWTSNNNNGLYYFEDGAVRGRTDYLCGKGDAFFNGIELRQVAGGYAAVPSTPANIGWVFKSCTFNGDGSGVDGNYTLGRPWGKGTPVAVFIDTKMNVVPSAVGWNEMSGGWPARFAEYNSTTASGSQIDLSGRKKIFAETHENNPVLSAAEALEYSDMSKMFGDWDPTLATEQAPVPANVAQNGSTLTWDDSNYALLWAVVKDGSIIGFTTEPTFELSETGAYAVRAANEMGGLSEASETVTITEVTGITTVKGNEPAASDGAIYTIQGVRVDKARKGLYIINGKKVIVK